MSKAPIPGACPFCRTPGLIAATAPDGRWYVDCIRRECKARGPLRPTAKEAVEAWNVGALPLAKRKKQ